jgi:hypothetical protein
MRVLRWIFGFDNLDHIAVRIVGVTLVFTWLLWAYGQLRSGYTEGWRSNIRRQYDC